MRAPSFRIRTLMIVVAVAAVFLAGFVAYPVPILATIAVATPCVLWAFVLGRLSKAMGINTYWTKVLVVFASSATIIAGSQVFLAVP